MAEDDDQSSKTEQPSQKKLDEARKRGEVVTSREISHWFMILGGTMFIMLIVVPTMKQIATVLSPLLTQPEALPVSDMAEIGAVLRHILKGVLLALAFPFIAFIVAAIAGPLLQTGPMWAPEHIEFKLERISFLGGIGRLFSKRNLVEFLKGLIKITVVGVLVYWLAWPAVPTIERTADMSIVLMMAELRKISLHILIGVLALVFIIAVADYLAQYFMFMSRQRMTRTEVKEEYKQTEGDPQIKQRLRQIRMERARRRMMADVPKASVIITNPDHYAVALRYDPPEHVAPIVVAMGVDSLAQKIKEVAREHDIPIVENPPLARALYATADLDKPIPSEHYRAVAEIISYVFKLKNKLGPRPRS